MKTELFLLTTLLALSGCQTAPVPPAVLPLPLAPSPAPAAVRVPEVVKTYTLGAYVDPDDPTLRHEAHMVQRIISPAHWNLQPAPVAKAEIPEAMSVPLPVVEDRPPTAPAVSVAPTPVVISPAIPAPVPDPEPALAPSADGLIDLTAAPAAADAEVNPFAVRKLPPEAVREITLHLDGIVHGAAPCALVNGHPLQPGDPFESLELVRIESDAVLLRYRGQLLRLPATGQPVRLRLPL